jgi:hypothetical protein
MLMAKRGLLVRKRIAGRLFESIVSGSGSAKDFPVPPMPTDRPYSIPPAKTKPLKKDYSRWAYVGIIVLILILVLLSVGWVFIS